MTEPNPTRSVPYSAALHRHIAGLIADFARCSDGRQWSALTQLLAPVVQLGELTESPTVVLSAAAFVSRWRTWLDGLGMAQHGLVAKYIAVYEQEATCFVDALITTCFDQERVLQWGGQFWFVFVCQADDDTRAYASDWRISKLNIVPLWITDSPETASVLARFRALMASDSGPLPVLH